MRNENKTHLSLSVNNTLTLSPFFSSKAKCFCATKTWPSSFSNPFFHCTPPCSFFHTVALMFFWQQLYQEWSPSYAKFSSSNSVKALLTGAKQMSQTLWRNSCAYGPRQNNRWLLIKNRVELIKFLKVGLCSHHEVLFHVFLLIGVCSHIFSVLKYYCGRHLFQYDSEMHHPSDICLHA